MNLDEFAPETDLEEEAKSNRPISEASQRPQIKASDDSSETTAQTKAATSKFRQATSSEAPYIYTTTFNQKQDLLFCAGAGKNEMRIFDFNSGSIVAMV